MSGHKPNRNKNQTPSGPKDNSGQKESTKRHVYVESGVQIDIVEDLKKQHQAERDEDKASHKKQLFWTQVAAILIFIYTVVMAGQLKVARDTFNASNRPYVGVNGIGPVFFKPGSTELTRRPTSETSAFSYTIEVKNFGPVPGTNFRVDQKVLFGGLAVTGTKVPDMPSTLFPGETVSMTGTIGTGNYNSLIHGDKTLVIEVAVEYDGPSAHYADCERHQFSPDVNGFIALGKSCAK